MTHSKGPVHPEHIAGSEAQAREWSRFCVIFGNPDRPRSQAKIEAAFGELLAPLLAEARSGWFFTRPRVRRKDDGPRDDPPAPDGFLMARRGRSEVNFAAPGIRTDRRFWWRASTEGAQVPFFTVPTRLLEKTDFLGPGSGPLYRTFRYDMPASAIHFAKQLVADGETIGVVPSFWEAALELRLFMSPSVAPRIARTLLEFEAGRNPVLRTFEPPRNQLQEWADKVRSDLTMRGIYGRDPEKRLLKLLEGGRNAADCEATQLALAAAEVVANLEGRPLKTTEQLEEWAERNQADLRKWAAEQDRLSPEVVALAAEVARGIAVSGALDPKLRTQEARDLTRASLEREIEDLVARLKAAGVTRRVQANAPNARPVPVSTKEIEQLAEPESWAQLTFYALQQDVLDFITFAREETGAEFAVATAEGGTEPLESMREIEEVLGGAFDGGLDARTFAKWRERQYGMTLRLWWPDVSPPPRVRERVHEKEEDDDGRITLDSLRSEPEPPPSALETVGWGWAALFVKGASINEEKYDGVAVIQRLLLQSSLSYPTGTELKRPRYRGLGPWRDVDWTAFRRKIRLCRAHLIGPLAGGRVDRSSAMPILRGAHARLAEGWELADECGLRWHKVRVR